MSTEHSTSLRSSSRRLRHEYCVNYPALHNRAYALMCEDGASDFEGDRLTDVFRPLLGLTLPPSAVSLVPNGRSLSPSALMLTAALTSLSWLVPQLGQVQ